MEADTSPAPVLPGELTSSAGMLPQLQPLGHLKWKEEKVTAAMLHGLGLETHHPVRTAPTLMTKVQGLVSIQWRKTDSTESPLAWPSVPHGRIHSSIPLSLQSTSQERNNE